MRNLMGCLSLLVVASLVGCGQTGALQLPSDPNYDKRAQYLLYKNTETQSKNEKKVNTQAKDRVDQRAASEISEIN